MKHYFVFERCVYLKKKLAKKKKKLFEHYGKGVTLAMISADIYGLETCS